MSKQLDGRTALVTGGSVGLGVDFSRSLADRGPTSSSSPAAKNGSKRSSTNSRRTTASTPGWISARMDLRRTCITLIVSGSVDLMAYVHGLAR